jgi:hypothetical protein
MTSLPRVSKRSSDDRHGIEQSLTMIPIRPRRRQNALKSSGTSPNFRNTVASRKSPVAGSSVRLNATAPAWPHTFQRPCARSIAATGQSIGSPTTMLQSATSNGSATRCSAGHDSPINHTSPYGRMAVFEFPMRHIRG